MLSEKVEEIHNKEFVYEGYYTVEAALLIPMVFFTFFFLMYMGIYQYDRCVCEQKVKSLLIRASNEELMDLHSGRWYGEINALPFMECNGMDIDTNSKGITVSVHGVIRTILDAFDMGYGKGFFTVRVKHHTENLQPVDFIWSVRKVERYVKGGFCE